MKDQKKTDIRVGLTVLLAIIVFLWILGWAKNITFNSNEQIMKIKFTSVAGLEIGDGVKLSGVKIGYIDNISIDGSAIIVTTILTEKVDLRADASFAIMMLDLMGGKKIEITPGVSQEKLDFSKIQTGVLLGDISTAMAMLGSVQSDLVDVIKEVKISLTNLNKIFGDENFTTELKNSIKNMNRLANQISAVVEENRSPMNKLLTGGAELTDSMNAFIKNNNENISSTIIDVKELLRNSNMLVVKVDSLFSDMKNNNIGKIIYDEKLIEDFKTSIQQVKELTKILVEQLKGKGLNIDIF